MRGTGLAVSAIAHAALLAWGLLSLHSVTPLDNTSIEQIPVDFIEFADETKIDKGVQTAALVEDVPVPPPAPKIAPEPPPLPKPDPVPEPEPTPLPPPPAAAPPQPPEPEPQPEPEPAPPQPEAAAPLPEPTPDDAPPPPPEKAAVVAPKDVPLPHIRPSRPAKPKPVPEESTSDIDQIQALLDKRKLEQMAAAEPAQEEKPTVGIASGTPNSKMTANELEALRARLAQCWSPPLGWTDPSEVRVVLMLNLNQDGTVSGAPEVVESPQGQYSTTAPESAVRAVRRCAPYNLPADKYDAWRQVRVTFDPRDMGGA